MQYAKAKSVSKEILSRGPKLKALILKTMKTCSDVVGSTLGPGGSTVVIERQEDNLPPLITKDGVTVFRNLGFDDASQQVLMEAARDASVRTANEAGDGTTTATILAEALVRRTMEFTDRNPKVSPQRVVRTLERGFKDVVEPWIKLRTMKADLGTEWGRKRLHDVAKISANGDAALAKAVMECFDLTGDEGNVTIVEASGPSGYEVERIEGYPVFKGYEDCCGKFYQMFINDPGRQMVALDKPCYVIIHARLNDIYSILPIMEKIDTAAQAGTMGPNVVLVATGFSEVVLAHLATNFRVSNSINVYPLVAPMNQMSTGQYDFLRDIVALSGGRIFDPLSNPVDNATLMDLGETTSFEAGRFRSTVLGFKEELLVLERVDELKQLLKTDISDLDRSLIQERIGKISGGIAKLKVIGASSGEVREKRDRAEDAVCAVRGALKHGALPGGGWALLGLKQRLSMGNEGFSDVENQVLDEVLGASLEEPVRRLFLNAGFIEEEIYGYETLEKEPPDYGESGAPLPAPYDYRVYNSREVDGKRVPSQSLGVTGIFKKIAPDFFGGCGCGPIGQEDPEVVFDVLEGKYVSAWSGGVLDSTPAVLEAIRNSISIASLLGTCGGTVVFKRDLTVERQEARDSQEFLRNANVNEADERP